MTDAAAFWDRIAPRYARMPVRDPGAYDETLARTRTYLPAEAELLEVGCGTGTTALRLADAAASITATDISPAMIAIAEEKGRAEGAGHVRFRVAAVAEDALPAGPFDAVLAFNLLHLLEDPEAAVRLLAARLKPGGVLITKSICIAEAGLHIRLLLPLMRLVGFAPPVRQMRAAELDALFLAAGLEILETGLYPASPPNRFVVARRPAA